jgi:hypothetical protein
VGHTSFDACKPSYRPMPIERVLFVNTFPGVRFNAGSRDHLRAGAPALTPTALSSDVLASILYVYMMYGVQVYSSPYS